jgi:hypothetical protein
MHPMRTFIRFILFPTLLALQLAGSAGPSTRVSATTCNPTIVFDFVPPLGSYQDLRGHVTCVSPADYFVAAYIDVSGWWTKPYWTSPLTPISLIGNWTVDITTGGVDQLATAIAVFLVPKGYSPPIMDGDAVLPADLYTSAVAYEAVTRREPRTVIFSGYTWKVKYTPILSGPGPNYFSDNPENVWVDENGYLHMKIAQRDGIWYCSEVINTRTALYGTHTFELGSRVDLLDKNGVLGLFSWDDAAPQYHYREVDIELARWGIESGPNSQYVVQPWDVTGNRHQFNIVQSTPGSIHSFDWLPDSIIFDSWDGNGNPLQSWTYTDSANIPPAGGNIHLNFWLMNGQPPSDGKDIEVVIKSYDFKRAEFYQNFYLPFIVRSLGQ